MILKGSQRGGASQMANHLLNVRDNEHVDVHDLRGFVASNLRDALREAQAISQGTRCKQFMFSLSLSPPETERVPVKAFMDAIRAIEDKLGLVDQPRAVVFHEKEGRRHAHCVWSRIDCEHMTAINLPHFKLKLRDMSRELYIRHGWKMPSGLVNSEERDPTTYTRAEWQQAKRAGEDPRALKTAMQDAWAISDDRQSFDNALRERGLWLARGDRRGFVAVDLQGEVYAIAKWVGAKTKDVRARLGDEASLRSVDAAKAEIAWVMSPVLGRHLTEVQTQFKDKAAGLSARKADMVQRHRRERERLKLLQKKRQASEHRDRAERFARGFRAIWDRLTGRHAALRRANEREAYLSFLRDRKQTDTLIMRQLDERQALQREIVQHRQARRDSLADTRREAASLSRPVSPTRNQVNLPEQQPEQTKRRGKARSLSRRRPHP